MRSSTAEEAIRLKEPKILTLEEAIEFINDDELVEVIPRVFACVKNTDQGTES